MELRPFVFVFDRHQAEHILSTNTENLTNKCNNNRNATDGKRETVNSAVYLLRFPHGVAVDHYISILFRCSGRFLLKNRSFVVITVDYTSDSTFNSYYRCIHAGWKRVKNRQLCMKTKPHTICWQQRTEILK